MIPALCRLRQEDLKFKASLVYILHSKTWSQKKEEKVGHILMPKGSVK
jgi:hypothetical protein